MLTHEDMLTQVKAYALTGEYSAHADNRISAHAGLYCAHADKKYMLTQVKAYRSRGEIIKNRQGEFDLINSLVNRKVIVILLSASIRSDYGHA